MHALAADHAHFCTLSVYVLLPPYTPPPPRASPIPMHSFPHAPMHICPRIPSYTAAETTSPGLPRGTPTPVITTGPGGAPSAHVGVAGSRRMFHEAAEQDMSPPAEVMHGDAWQMMHGDAWQHGHECNGCHVCMHA